MISFVNLTLSAGTLNGIDISSCSKSVSAIVKPTSDCPVCLWTLCLRGSNTIRCFPWKYSRFPLRVRLNRLGLSYCQRDLRMNLWAGLAEFALTAQGLMRHTAVIVAVGVCGILCYTENISKPTIWHNWQWIAWRVFNISSPGNLYRLRASLRLV